MYESEKTCSVGPGCAPGLPEENLTDVLRETRVMASDVLNMSRKIRSHLFGSREEPCTEEAKPVDPSCFREEMGELRRKLMNACQEIAEICTKVGV